MNTNRKGQRASSRAVKVGFGAVCMLLAAGGIQAAPLWTNGTLSVAPPTECDSGPGTCGNSSLAAWTIFDNFNVPTGTSWTVQGFDYTDLFFHTPAADYTNTKWSLWSGDPLNGGKLVASGLTLGQMTLQSGSCGAGSTCVELINVALGAPVYLSSGTYFLGTTSILSNTADTTYREFANGGNTAPGGTANTLQKWEQSNGSISGSTWALGANNNTGPSTGITDAATR